MTVQSDESKLLREMLTDSENALLTFDTEQAQSDAIIFIARTGATALRRGCPKCGTHRTAGHGRRSNGNRRLGGVRGGRC